MYKRKLNRLVILVIGLSLFSCHGNLTVRWWSSTPKKLWEEQRNILLQKYDSTITIDAEIFTDSVEQEIDGFGGCFNELGWDALSKIDEISSKKVLSMLFSAENGLNFNICRVPNGASDFARNFYSLDDSVNDYSLDYFNIERDKKILIPYVKAAMHFQKHLKIWSAPWTPPVWMKINQNYACKSSKKNSFVSELEGNNNRNQILFNDTVLKVYAKYFVKYIKAYKEEDIRIYGIYVQNSFGSCQTFPSCTWTFSSVDKFIGNYLGPQFNKDRIKTEIWFGTIEKPLTDSIISEIENITCSEYIKGFGFQWNGKEIASSFHLKYPKIKLMQTENESGDGSNNWQTAMQTFNYMKLYFNAGINAYLYNNMILDESGLNIWGRKQNSLITINSQTKKVIYNPEYYIFKHFSYIVPGSMKVMVKGKFNNILSFITPANDLIIVAANVSSIPKILRIKVENKIIETVISKNSINSFLYFNAV